MPPMYFNGRPLGNSKAYMSLAHSPHSPWYDPLVLGLQLCRGAAGRYKRGAATFCRSVAKRLPGSPNAAGRIQRASEQLRQGVYAVSSTALWAWAVIDTHAACVRRLPSVGAGNLFMCPPRSQMVE